MRVLTAYTPKATASNLNHVKFAVEGTDEFRRHIIWLGNCDVTHPVYHVWNIGTENERKWQALKKGNIIELPTKIVLALLVCRALSICNTGGVQNFLREINR